jgi:TRAP-type mannitol/chloroaromatic compound transport system substrate-binding protein
MWAWPVCWQRAWLLRCAARRLRWRLVTSFPKSSTPSLAGPKFAQSLRLMSGGQIEVSVHSAGELMPAFGVMEGCRTAWSKWL